MELAAIALVLFAYAAAGFVKGTTGLGFSTTALPLIVFATGHHEAMALVLAPSIASNIVVMVQVGGFGAALRRFWPLYLGLVPGLACGLWVLSRTSPTATAAVLGIVLILYGLWGLAQPHWRLPIRWNRPLAAPVGALTGLVNGVTGSQVFPILPFLLAFDLSAALFVQAINISFTLSSVIMAIGLSQIGLITTTVLTVSVVGLLPAWAALAAGGWVRRRLSEAAFRRAVLLVLLIIGVGLIVRA